MRRVTADMFKIGGGVGGGEWKKNLVFDDFFEL